MGYFLVAFNHILWEIEIPEHLELIQSVLLHCFWKIILQVKKIINK